MKFRTLIFFLLLFLITVNVLFAQINSKFDESFNKLVVYISSEEFKELKTELNDLELIDSIYSKSIIFTNNDISESLLALTFATLPFDYMPIRIPIINQVINIKLQDVSPSIFNKKNNNLPSYIFFDTPTTGDKDKLAHFFGNAFLSYNVSIFNISKILGIFVELFEESFKVGGGLDTRDLEVNNYGEFFGKMLNRNNKLMPSEVLSIYILLHNNFYN